VARGIAEELGQRVIVGAGAGGVAGVSGRQIPALCGIPRHIKTSDLVRSHMQCLWASSSRRYLCKATRFLPTAAAEQHR